MTNSAPPSSWHIDERAVNPVAASVRFRLIEVGRKWRSCLTYPAIMTTRMSHQLGKATSLDIIGERAPVRGRRSINFLFAPPPTAANVVDVRRCFLLCLFSFFL